LPGAQVFYKIYLFGSFFGYVHRRQNHIKTFGIKCRDDSVPFRRRIFDFYVKLFTKRFCKVDLKANFDTQRVQQNKLVDQLEAEQEKLQKEQQSLEDHFDNVVELSKDVEARIVAEQKRLAEIARKAEQERKKRAAKKSSGSNSSGGSSSAPAISSGDWTTPSTGRFTSPYGNRFHPIFKEWRLHAGVDIANVTGTPIYAAGDGGVSHAGWLGGFGNAIMITHSVEGKVYTTVYAHLSSVGVSKGQTVDKGQKIGGMGTTGDSTGTHLHFQLHDGYYSSSNTLNPLRYIPF